MARVLVVDDSVFLTKAIGRFLEEIGHSVVGYAHNADDGVELYWEHRPDLVLLDITMPNKDGRECLREILAGDSSARVLMISAITERDVVVDCLSAGAKGYVAKPLKLLEEPFRNELCATITQVLTD